MRRLLAMLAILGIAQSAAAAPNVTNATQKGSLLVFPDIRAIGSEPQEWNTLVRLQNDGPQDVDVKCYWMDRNKHRVDFVIPVTRNQPVWFDARTGNGTFQVNPIPNTPANGFENPFFEDGGGPTGRGLLACWAVDASGQNQVKWNHLSGTATVYSSLPSAFGPRGAYEYHAYAFTVPTGLDLEAVGVAGTLNLNGVEYDSCPLYQIGQLRPSPAPQRKSKFEFYDNRLAVAGCTLDLRQDWLAVWTKLQFDVWNEEEVKFTGAFECADSWHDTDFGNDIDAAAQNFWLETLGTVAARYRVQGVKSTQCEEDGRTTQAVGILAVQSTSFGSCRECGGVSHGTTLAAAGKFTGKISWDPADAVPEGGIR